MGENNEEDPLWGKGWEYLCTTLILLAPGWSVKTPSVKMYFISHPKVIKLLGEALQGQYKFLHNFSGWPPI